MKIIILATSIALATTPAMAEENRIAAQLAFKAAGSPQFPWAGIWKEKHEDRFGWAISPAGEGKYFVSFCAGSNLAEGSCFDPGTYLPITTIVGDHKYMVVNNNTLKIKWSIKAANENPVALHWQSIIRCHTFASGD